MELISNYKHHYYSTPSYLEQIIQEVCINEANIETNLKRDENGKFIKGKNKRKKEVASYLLIGFDTEYQSQDSVTKEEIKAGARNQLLSYQLSVRKIDKEAQNQEIIQADEIIIPDKEKGLNLRTLLQSL